MSSSLTDHNNDEPTLPQNMRAVVASQPGGPEVLSLTQRPRPIPGEHDILVRVVAAGVNRPDVMQRQGLYPPPPGASDILGLEVAGTVVASGSNVKRFTVGQRAMALVASGGYADYVVVHETNALPVPDTLSLTEAGAIPETFFTVWTNVFERGALRAGETLLVHGGSSGIGTTATQLAKALGARVFVTAGSEEKCQACRDLGADLAINYATQDFVAEAREATDGRGVDVILDMVGGDYVNRNLELAAPDGRVVQIAFMKQPKVNIDLRHLMPKRVYLTGSTLRPRSVEQKADIAKALEQTVLPLWEQGRCKPVIDSTFTLGDAPAAHRRIEHNEHIGKIVLLPGANEEPTG